MYNKVILHGRLVRDPESFATASGMSICKFTICNNRKYKDKEDALFMECKAFGAKGDACFRCLKKGSECIVSGILATEKWQGKDGQEHQKNVINAEEVEFIGKPPQSEPQQPQYRPQQAQYQQPPAYQQRQVTQPMQEAIQQAVNEQQEPAEDDIPF